ncbi:RNA polymerase factor sigma-32 [Terrihabitans sp. B22-R8]|uniref:RNA polymerase factor sigma-32 n=1 Tax=Terrihabitans sp. B22-R8 TaxID=3425128 RepID=UPI00403D491A
MASAEGVGPGFVRRAMNAPFLQRDEEHVLAVRWKEGREEAALHRLAASHMRLVISVAGKFRHYGLSMSDLIQEGHVGLLEAAARFDPDREVRFSTYATWWIRAAIQDYVLRNWSIVRGGTSSTQKALFFSLRRLRWRLARQSEGLSNTEIYREIAQAVGVSEADVATMDSRLSGPDMSLNAPLTDGESDSSERMDFLVDDGPLPEEIVAERVDEGRRNDWLRDALKVLDERELKIIRARQLAEESQTLEALGAVLGISKERVRQIEHRALQKLKRALEGGMAAFV